MLAVFLVALLLCFKKMQKHQGKIESIDQKMLLKSKQKVPQLGKGRTPLQ